MTWMLDQEFLEKLDLGAYDAAAIAKRLDLPLDVAQTFFDPNRQYQIKTNLTYGWVAGTSNGKPTLVFVGYPRLAAENEAPLNAISFDVATNNLTTSSVAVDDDDGLSDEDYVLGMLEDELAFEHVGHVELRAFKYPGMWHYALVPLSFHLHDIVTGAGACEPEDIESARDWIQSGSYVLHCGNAYFMSSTGEVESS